MLTPLDIQNKEFEKAFRGYKEIQVDSFLDEVIADYEFVFKENLELKGKIDMLNEQIKSYSSMETTLQKTLVVAQNTADEVIKNAREQEENIISQAEHRASKIIESARDQTMASQKEYEAIRREIMMFKNKYKSLLKAQLDTIDHYSEENVFSLLDDMKEEDFVFDKQDKVEPQSKPQEESIEESIYASTQEDVEVQQPEEKLFDEETLIEDDPFKDSYREESDAKDSLGLYIESLESELEKDEKDKVKDLSRQNKRPILD